MVSKMTETTIRIEVPPIPVNKANVIPVPKIFGSDGSTAMNPKNIAPINVSLINIAVINFVVASPGRIPGIKPPDFFKLSEISLGLNAINV